MDAGNVPLALALVPAALLGKAIGTRSLKRVSENAFRALTLVILTGSLGVATAVWALL